MRLDDVRKKYRNEWVLIEFSKLGKDLRAKDGKVIAHSPTKEEIYRDLLRARGKNVSIEYCGKMPEDLAVMFCNDEAAENIFLKLNHIRQEIVSREYSG